MKYVIIGTNYRGDEIIDTVGTIREARYLVKEYRLAFGPEWSIRYRLRRKSND
jgi:hypothetical protein